MHERPLKPGSNVLLHHGTAQIAAHVKEIVYRINPETFDTERASQLALNEIGLILVETARATPLDRYRDNRRTGSFVLVDRIDNFTLAAGMVERAIVPQPALRQEVSPESLSAPVTPAERLQRYGHRAGLVISRSKVLRQALERALFERGAAVVVVETPPRKVQLCELLASGLMVLSSPPPTTADLDGVDWIEAPERMSIGESICEVLKELERLDLLVSRGFSVPGGGYLNGR
jgi:sulfate adenylyltransferase subunit 1